MTAIKYWHLVPHRGTWILDTFAAIWRWIFFSSRTLNLNSLIVSCYLFPVIKWRYEALQIGPYGQGWGNPSHHGKSHPRDLSDGICGIYGTSWTFPHKLKIFYFWKIWYIKNSTIQENKSNIYGLNCFQKGLWCVGTNFWSFQVLKKSTF